VRVLPPWVENLPKRQVKAPKIYIRDSGLPHALLELRDLADLGAHPKLGASWEGFALEQVLTLLGTRNAFFWATHGGAELDLLVTVGGRRCGFEFKVGEAAGSTRSMRVAFADLRLAHLWIVYPGSDAYEIDERISVLPLRDVPALRDRIAAT